MDEILKGNYPTTEEGWVRQTSLDYKSTPILGKLLNDLYLNYDRYSIHNDIETIPFTNNLSERNFIAPKQRYKLTRGFKSSSGCLNYFRNFNSNISR